MGGRGILGKLAGLLAALLIALAMPAGVARADESSSAGDTGLGGQGSITVDLAYVDERGRTLEKGWVAIYLVGVATYDEDGNAYFGTANDVADYVETGDIVFDPDSDVMQSIRAARTDEELDRNNASYADWLAADAKENKIHTLRTVNAVQQIKGGQVRFTGLVDGLYLIVQTEFSQSGLYFNPYLISMPGLDEYNMKTRDVVAEPKAGTTPMAGALYHPMSYGWSKDGRWTDADEPEPEPEPEPDPNPDPDPNANPNPNSNASTSSNASEARSGTVPVPSRLISMPGYTSSTYDGSSSSTSSAGSSTSGSQSPGSAASGGPTATTVSLPNATGSDASPATAVTDNASDIVWQSGASTNGAAASNVGLKVPRTGDDTMSVVPFLVAGAAVVVAGIVWRIVRRNRG